MRNNRHMWVFFLFFTPKQQTNKKATLFNI